MSDLVEYLPNQAFPMSIYPGDGDPIEYAPEYMRRLIDACFDVAGVLQPNDFRIKQHAAGDFTLDIEPGGAIIDGPTFNEKYLVWVEDEFNVDVAGSIATSPVATRTHKVYLVVSDKNYSGSEQAATLYIAEDTGSGAGTPAGSPVGYILLGTFTTGPSQPSILTANISFAPPHAGRYKQWTDITLAAGFVDGSSGNYKPQWKREGNTVRLRGNVARTASAEFTAASYTLCTLPTSARPGASRNIYTVGALNQPVANDIALCRIQITPAGAVIAAVGAMTSPGDQPTFVSLDGIMFDTD